MVGGVQTPATFENPTLFTLPIAVHHFTKQKTKQMMPYSSATQSMNIHHEADKISPSHKILY